MNLSANFNLKPPAGLNRERPDRETNFSLKPPPGLPQGGQGREINLSSESQSGAGRPELARQDADAARPGRVESASSRLEEMAGSGLGDSVPAAASGRYLFSLINQRSGLYMVNQKVKSSLEQQPDKNSGAGNRNPGPSAQSGRESKLLNRAYYESLANEAAQRHRLDPHLVRAVINAESSFNPNLVSKAGAVGLMQLMPGTASDMKVDDPFDPAQNIEGGTKYLAWLRQKFDGDENKILAAYNWGPGNVDKGGTMPLETRNYLQRVKRFREEFQRAASPKSEILAG
jgi:soluble lytic murein transglycosylase-like protein